MATYGSQKATDVFDNVGAELVMGTGDQVLAKQIEERLGDATINVITHTRPRFFPFFNVDRQTDAEHPHRRPGDALAAEIDADALTSDAGPYDPECRARCFRRSDGSGIRRYLDKTGSRHPTSRSSVSWCRWTTEARCNSNHSPRKRSHSQGWPRGCTTRPTIACPS